MSKLNGFGKTHQERKFVVELKFKNWFIRQRAFIGYEARGKFRGHERCLRVARAVSLTAKQIKRKLKRGKKQMD